MTGARLTPPRLAERILSHALDSKDRDHVLGDFAEFYAEVRGERGSVRAFCWYWSQALNSIPHLLRNYAYWRCAMIVNYLKVAVRNIMKYKSYSLINVTGLATGMACCIVIFLYITNEIAYDRYHKDRDRIFRILEYRKVPAGEFVFAPISAAVATVVRADFPEVEHAARIMPVSNGLVQCDNLSFYEDKIYYADQELFSIFSLTFISGDAATALGRPGTVVITERMAEKYFGDEDPIGKLLGIKDPAAYRIPNFPEVNYFEVTGVVMNPPANTHFKYDFIASIEFLENTWVLHEWHAGPTYTYIKLSPEGDAEVLENRLQRIAYDYVGDDLTAWGQTRHYFLQRLDDIHFQARLRGLPIRGETEAHGNMRYIYIYCIVGFLVLMIGCMNFINLSNSRSIYRTKEVGLRKVVGARRLQLARQFLGESLVITVMAIAVAFLIVQLLLPSFNTMAGTQLSLADFTHWKVIVAIFCLTVFVGAVAGGYPAFVLTSMKPADSIRGMGNSNTSASSALKILVTGQFAISIFLSIGTIAVFQQLHFMRGGALGFQKEQKYIIPFRNNARVRNSYIALKGELLSNGNIFAAAASSGVPGRPLHDGYLNYTDDKLEKPWKLNFLSCDHEFVPEYKLEICVGRSFRDEKYDEDNAFIINEAAVSHLGFTSAEEALGTRLHEAYYRRYKNIIGVVKDFHYQGMQHEIEPLYLEYSPSRFDFLTLRLSTEHVKETVAFIGAKWSQLYPDLPFEGFFLDEDFDRQYRQETGIAAMLSTVAGMGLLIASLGLLGLAAFVAQQRRREIGIRKVLGATVPSIVTLLSKRFCFLVIVAAILATPLAYCTINRWLQDFAYRITMSWMTFVLPSFSALLIALATVGIQGVRAAMTDPVETLKCE